MTHSPLDGVDQIKWVEEKLGFDGRVVSIEKDPDAWSLYHRTLDAFFYPYRTQFMNGETISRENQVGQLVDRLVEMLDKLAEGKSTYYQTLYGGKLPEQAAFIPKYTLDGFRKELTSETAGCAGRLPDSVVIEYLSLTIGKGIYILDDTRGDVTVLGCEPAMRELKGNIVLLYNRQNDQRNIPYFSMVAVLPESNEPEELVETAVTHFSSSHPFITAIRDRIDQLNTRPSRH